MREEVIGNARLILGDCREVLPTLGRVDAVVTSPPYDDIREYGGHATVDCLAVIGHIADILADGGVCVWNVGDQVVDGSETGTSFRQALHALECGLRLHDTMIVCKEAVSFPGHNRYHPATEYVFVFSKGAPRHFNGIKDWRNKSAGTAVFVSARKKDGTIERSDAGPRRFKPAESLRRNWWIVSNPHRGDYGDHPAPMPASLASDHIITWTDLGELVVDPFLGSGTTGIACAKLGRSFIGIEIHEPYFDTACRRIEAAQRQSDLFVSSAPQPEARTPDMFAEIAQ